MKSIELEKQLRVLARLDVDDGKRYRLVLLSAQAIDKFAHLFVKLPIFILVTSIIRTARGSICAWKRSQPTFPFVEVNQGIRAGPLDK